MPPPPQAPVFTWELEPTVERSRRSASSRAEAQGREMAWELKRDPPRPHDPRLSPLAARWLADQPEGAKPTALCERFPRIANRLALAWKDATLALILLDDLLVGRRPGRKGFPPEVAAELKLLAAEARRRQAGPAA